MIFYPPGIRRNLTSVRQAELVAGERVLKSGGEPPMPTGMSLVSSAERWFGTGHSALPDRRIRWPR
jgi:hypothetical protein